MMALRETPLSIRFGPRRQGMDTIQIDVMSYSLFFLTHFRRGRGRFLAEMSKWFYLLSLLSSFWVSHISYTYLLRFLFLSFFILMFLKLLHAIMRAILRPVHVVADYTHARDSSRDRARQARHRCHHQGFFTSLFAFPTIGGSLLKFSLLLCRSSKANPLKSGSHRVIEFAQFCRSHI